MSQAARREDFIWVIVEKRGDQESFLGLTREDGKTFILATEDRDQGMMLQGRLPQPEAGVQRDLEAINKARLLQQAQEEGMSVYMVDAQGHFLRQLGGDTEH